MGWDRRGSAHYGPFLRQASAGFAALVLTLVAPCRDAAGQLVEEGKLDLDRTPQDYLDLDIVRRVPNTGTATLRHLLNHQSGIPTWEFQEDWIRAGRGDAMELGRVWGSAWSSKPSPATMPRRRSARGSSSRSISETPSSSRSRRSPAANLSPEWTAGGIVASASDLVRWAQAMRDGELLGPAMHREHLTYHPPRESHGGRGQYLQGLSRTEGFHGDYTAVGHSDLQVSPFSLFLRQVWMPALMRYLGR